MTAVGVERIFGGKNEVAAIGGRKLEVPGHAHGSIGGGLLAFAAEDAAAIVHGDLTQTVAVADCDGPGRARVGGGTSVFPGSKVELRASAELIGEVRRDTWIIGRRGTNAERFLQDLEHGVTGPSLNKTS